MPTLTFWLDVDNTLLNNDAVKQDFDRHLQIEIGPALTKRFWDIYEQVRHEKDVIDIPLSLTRFREQTSKSELDGQTYQHISSIFYNYPFVNALYPHTLETLRYLNTLGKAVIVSDGDLVFQAQKITTSGLSDAVEGRVLLYIHKQEHLDEIMKLYLADHYVMIDDKPQILVDLKAALRNKITTVFVQQGKYSEQRPEHFEPDFTVAHIADVQYITAEQFLQNTTR